MELLKFELLGAVAARHILCEKQGKINEAYKKLQEGWLDSGDKVPPAEFAKVICPLFSVWLDFCNQFLASLHI